MFTVEATPGVSIVIRSKDPNFSPNNMIFVTEYSGMDGSQSSIPFNLSILKESDQAGHLLRISVVAPQSEHTSVATTRPRPTIKTVQPVSPASSYASMSRMPSPNSMNYPSMASASSSSSYPSPSPSLPQQIPYSQPLQVQSSNENSMPFTTNMSSSSTSQNDADMMNFSDFGEILNNFHEAFPHTYGDMNVMGSSGLSIADQHRQNQYYSSDLLLNSSNYTLSHSSFMTSPTVTDDSDLHSTHSNSNGNSTATPLVSSPPSLPADDNNSPKNTDSSSSDQSDPKRIFTCRHDGCEKRFARKYHRQVHENSHKPKVRMLLTCREGECTARFGRPHDRMRHEVAKHGLKPNFICKNCGKFFGTESKLSGHKCDLLPTQRHRWTELAAAKDS